MARDDRDVANPQVELLRPQVALLGEVNEDMLTQLVDGLKTAEQGPGDGPVTVEMLLIHCRQREKTVNISGPIRGSRPLVESRMHQLDVGVRMEEDNFQRLIEGSDVSMDELLKKALYNWYVPAQEALERGLIGGIV